MAESIHNNQEMRRMQDEALKRAREMQKRAKITVEPPQMKTSTTMQRKSIKKSPSLKLNNPINDIMDSLLEDSERTMILILILILVTEEADMSLVLALMYLII